MDKIQEIKRSSSRLYNRLVHRETSKIQLVTSVDIERKTVVWTIENIDKSPTNVGECVESPVFRTGSSEITKWSLRFYPKGKLPASALKSGFYLFKITPGTKVHVEVKLYSTPPGNCAVFCNGGNKMIFEDSEEIGTESFMTLQMTKSLELRCELKVGYLPTPEDDDRADSDPPAFNCNCSLSADFEKLYKGRQFTDAILQVGNKEFHVHKAVLAARSKVFNAMFEHQMKENESGIAKIENVEPTTMASFLQYIYTGKVDDININKAIMLFEVADAYAIPELQIECSKFLLDNMSVDNVCSIAVMADLHCEIKLREAAAQYICKHATQVFEKGEWDALASERPRLAANVVKNIITSFKTDFTEKRDRLMALH